MNHKFITYRCYKQNNKEGKTYYIHKVKQCKMAFSTLTNNKQLLQQLTVDSDSSESCCYYFLAWQSRMYREDIKFCLFQCKIEIYFMRHNIFMSGIATSENIKVFISEI